ncbi:hypothetical protein KUTeg_011020 [Tegillarca granosa]|uniref:Beta-lactamase-related domain-containing protein n=1 Tax=Tegillarca granosa TaxID=220873 RepID=A0ABQ9F5Y0_TEGGR|nr:hypothetical protein KUTeg_011020 [Tegillarca granosa]
MKMNIRILTLRTITSGKSIELLQYLNARRYLFTTVKNLKGPRSLLSLYPKYRPEHGPCMMNHSGEQSSEANHRIGRNFVPIRGIQTQNENDHDKFRKTRNIWLLLGTLAAAAGVSWYAGKSYISCEEKSEKPMSTDTKNTEKSQNLARNESKITLEEAIEKSRDIIQRIKDETGGPGIVVAVSIDGKEVWSEGFGYADVENRTPCTPDTVLRIASISKSIAMVTVARLWESGQLDIDKPIPHYVPTFPEKSVDGEKVAITTRQLMSHLSGIRNYNKNYMKPNKNEQNKEIKSTDLQEFHIKKHYSTVEESMSIFKDDPLVHKPGIMLKTREED